MKDGTARIRIVDCANALWGVISWQQKPGGRDTQNPDPAKRGRPTLGLPILLDMQPSEPNKWEGQIYNAENGRTYDASITLSDPNTLEVEGCVMGFLCGGEDWSRVQSGQGGSANLPPGGPATAPATAICSAVGAGRPH